MTAFELGKIIAFAIDKAPDVDGEPGYLLAVTSVEWYSDESRKITVRVLGDDEFAGGDIFEVYVRKANLPSRDVMRR